MLIITDLQGNTEPVVDYKSLEINEEVNGDFSLACTFINSEKNKHAYDLMAEESMIEYEGHEYRIKKIVKDVYRKQVQAPHIFFDLIDHQIYDKKGGTMYVSDAFSFALNGTGWTYEVVDEIPPQLLLNFGEDNALSLIRKACELFECEIKIEPGKHLTIYKQIGKDDDYQFRYKHNIKAIKESVDTTKLATVIRGYGGNNLQVTYTSPNVSVFGERHAEPIRDDNIIDSSTMTETLKRTLNDVPDASIELDAILLEGAELGDTVWLIHEKLGIEFQTRIMASKRHPQTPAADSVVLGNRKQTLSDLLTETKIEINENAKQFRSKIEQTNNRITLEVESVNKSIATLELTDTQIRTEVANLETNVNSKITQTASEIMAEVQAVDDSVAALNIKADEIRSEVKSVDKSVAALSLRADNIVLSVQSLDNRMGQAESSISIQAGEISSKVSRNGVISAINQSPESITLDAHRINLLGITNVAQELQIGSYGSGGTKTIKFNGQNRINDNGVVTTISAQQLTLDTTFLNLSYISTINWGNNTPTAKFG